MDCSIAAAAHALGAVDAAAALAWPPAGAPALAAAVGDEPQDFLPFLYFPPARAVCGAVQGAVRWMAPRCASVKEREPALLRSWAVQGPTALPAASPGVDWAEWAGSWTGVARGSAGDHSKGLVAASPGVDWAEWAGSWTGVAREPAGDHSKAVIAASPGVDWAEWAGSWEHPVGSGLLWVSLMAAMILVARCEFQAGWSS
jgi:hypothetical protein